MLNTSLRALARFRSCAGLAFATGGVAQPVNASGAAALAMLHTGTAGHALESPSIRHYSATSDRKYHGKLHGKVALITGGGSGIGRESALLFAHEGATVVIADMNEPAAKKVAKEVTNAGGYARAIRADVSRAEDCLEMVHAAEHEFGALNILFNNAGVMLMQDSDAENTPEAIIDTTFDINVKGVINGCKYGIPAMRRAGGGSIINTASFVAFMGAATPQIAYTASKGAVLAATREMAVTHARENIRVNALCPGPIHTNLLMKKRRLIHVPMGRFAEAAEMARAALFLASDDSSFMTGASLVIDGGITAAYVTPE
eukprot:jgi/Mesvir1/18274/Mv09541-RA.1